MQHNFKESLAFSHAAEDLPIWREVYPKFFPNMIAMHSHRDDGQHQRNGIDRSVILANSKQVLIDEKVRGRNKITNEVYEDIALEFLSDAERKVPGWVRKPLLADYIAYAIAPLGICYMLPVVPLQKAWLENCSQWRTKYKTINAKNNGWTTASLCVPASVVLGSISDWMSAAFTKTEIKNEGQ